MFRTKLKNGKNQVLEQKSYFRTVVFCLERTSGHGHRTSGHEEKKRGFHSAFGRSSGRALPLERNWAARAAKVGTRAANPVSAYTL